MRSILILCVFLGSFLNCTAQTSDNEPIAVFAFTLEFELANDQGELASGDYIKQYGTKGKTRAHEVMYPLLEECMIEQMKNKQLAIEKFNVLSDIKENVYGYPVMTINKAVKSGRYKRYLKITLKDIGQLPMSQVDAPGQAVIPVKMRCRIALYDQNKKIIKQSEGIFGTGEKVGDQYDIGVDLRQYQGSGSEQELKFYEVCCKMAFLRALEKF